ncbi:hypothetical protein BC567DRAFT_267608 [Phyllosticta citribraziliensis]
MNTEPPRTIPAGTTQAMIAVSHLERLMQLKIDEIVRLRGQLAQTNQELERTRRELKRSREATGEAERGYDEMYRAWSEARDEQHHHAQVVQWLLDNCPRATWWGMPRVFKERLERWHISWDASDEDNSGGGGGGGGEGRADR